MATTYTHTRASMMGGWLFVVCFLLDDMMILVLGEGGEGQGVVEGEIEEGEGEEFLYKIHPHRLSNFIRKHIKVIIFIKLVTGGYTPHTHTSV